MRDTSRVGAGGVGVDRCPFLSPGAGSRAAGRPSRADRAEASRPMERLSRNARGSTIPMVAIVLIALITIGFAIVLAALLPGAGLIGGIVVVLLGIGLIVWLVAAGASRQTPSDIARETPEHE